LAFASASGQRPLTSPHATTPVLIMQKARGKAFPLRGIAPPLLVSAWFQDLFHSPNRGSFHCWLTLLFRYRSPGSIQPYVMVHADSSGLSRDPLYLGNDQRRHVRFRLRGSHPLWPDFPEQFG